MPISTADAWVDEEGERLLAGQLFQYPARLEELHRPADLCTGPRRILLAILSSTAAASRDLPALLPALRTAGVARLAIECVAAWDHTPVPLADLLRDLRAVALRRALNRAGRILIGAARSPAPVLPIATAALRDLADVAREVSDA